MYIRRLTMLILLNILGISLFLSWYLPFGHDFWFYIDKKVFFYFQNMILNHPSIALIVSISNIRIFDIFILLIIISLYFNFSLKETKPCYKYMLVLGINIFITCVILNKISHLIPIKHVSPTLFFDNKHQIHTLAGMIVKDSSNNSFPGDHGMLLMIFLCFILRYFNFCSFVKTLFFTTIFIMPRIMSGAHWFTDIFVGSLSIVLIFISWWFLTFSSDKFINWLYFKISK